MQEGHEPSLACACPLSPYQEHHTSTYEYETFLFPKSLLCELRDRVKEYREERYPSLIEYENSFFLTVLFPTLFLLTES